MNKNSSIVNILSLDVVVLIESYKMMYFFRGLSFILKGLHISLKNKHFIWFSEKLHTLVQEVKFWMGVEKKKFPS